MRKVNNLPLSCAVVMKSGNLNFLELSGTLQACNGTAIPFTITLKDLKQTALSCRPSDCAVLVGFFVQARVLLLMLIIGLLLPLLPLLVAQHTATAIVFG